MQESSLATFCTPFATTKRANVLVEEMPTGPAINAFFATPRPPAVTMLPVEVEELSVVAEKFTAPVNVAPERVAYCERVAPLSAMILPVVPENTASSIVSSAAGICYKIVDC